MSEMHRSIRPSAKGSSSELGNASKTYDGKIAGLYDLEETLGRGHFAVVKLARHVFTGEKVAVKVIDKNKLDEVSKAHLFQEVRCMKLVQHPNVVRLYDVIDTATKLYLILELGDGGDLYEYIMRHDTGLPEHIAKEYFSQIVRAISYCHQLHVVHRDLKPENVVFFKKQGVVKLTDFGFSNKFYPGQKLETSCGSLAYSAPEILLGDSYDAPAVDVWSLGVILFMLVCGQAPFQEANDSETLTMIMDCKYEIPMHVSQNCRKLISRMLLRSPEKRATLAEISEHPWLSSNGQNIADALPLVSKEQLSEEDHNFIVQKIANGKIATKEEIQESLEKNEYNHVTATYFLLAERKLRSKRQMQVDKNKRPEELAVRQQDHSKKDTNATIKPSLLNVPRTPGDLPQRSRKCSIVQEDEEEEDMSSCSGREDLGMAPLNRRGSRSEGRLNLTIQERIAEAETRRPVERKHGPCAKKTSQAKTAKGGVSLPAIPAGDGKSEREDRRARLHKSRTASCSSSDASDDDSEKRKKRAQKLTTPSRSFEMRRDSHDDSSDSQEAGGASGGPSSAAADMGVATPTSGGDGHNSQEKNGGTCTNGRSHKLRKARLRESQSLNRITEVQEEAAAAQQQGVATSATMSSIAAAPKGKSVGARILHGFHRSAKKEEGDKTRASRRDSVRMLADKMEGCNKVRRIRVFGKYFHVHRRICAPLAGFFRKNGLYKAQSCGSLAKDRVFLNSGRGRAVSVVQSRGDINQNKESPKAVLDVNAELTDLCAVHVQIGHACKCSFC